MSNRFTGSLVVCVAAAGVALGALALESDDEPATAAGTPTTAADTGGYGAANDAGAVADGGEAGEAGATLQVRDFSFSDTSVAPGGQVTVANADGTVHTVTADGGEFDTGEVQGGGNATFQAPGQSGTYPFFCEIHPGMSGTLTVG
jgi:plastocyanin